MKIKPINYIPMGYLAKRLVVPSDASVFNCSMTEVANLLIDDYKEDDKILGLNTDYVLVDLTNSMMIYRKYIGDV